jgi:hypothetical protein
MHQSEFSACSAEAVLNELAEAARNAEIAALAGQLPELEIANSRQMQLCGELRDCVDAINARRRPLLEPGAHSTACRLHAQLKILASVLRRIQKNVLIMSHTLQRVSVVYGPGAHQPSGRA